MLYQPASPSHQVLQVLLFGTVSSSHGDCWSAPLLRKSQRLRPQGTALAPGALPSLSPVNDMTAFVSPDTPGLWFRLADDGALEGEHLTLSTCGETGVDTDLLVLRGGCDSLSAVDGALLRCSSGLPRLRQLALKIEHPGQLFVLVPSAASSSGTLLAFGGSRWGDEPTREAEASPYASPKTREAIPIRPSRRMTSASPPLHSNPAPSYPPLPPLVPGAQLVSTAAELRAQLRAVAMQSGSLVLQLPAGRLGGAWTKGKEAEVQQGL